MVGMEVGEEGRAKPRSVVESVVKKRVSAEGIAL